MVEDLDHERSKGQVLLRVQDLCQSAVDCMGIHIYTQLSVHQCVRACVCECVERGKEDKVMKMGHVNQSPLNFSSRHAYECVQTP